MDKTNTISIEIPDELIESLRHEARMLQKSAEELAVQRIIERLQSAGYLQDRDARQMAREWHEAEEKKRDSPGAGGVG